MDKIKFRYTYIVTDEQLQNELEDVSKPKHILKHLKTRDCNQLVIEQAINCFHAEIEKLKKLNYSQCQVAQIIEAYEKQQEFYIVYEYINGDNLSNKITNNNLLNEEQVIDLLQQVLKILKYIHQQNVKHLNIKPSNLIKQSDGKIFLIDFGGFNEISTLSFNDKTQGFSKQPVGTKGYMAPEQEKGHTLYSNCDLYALGMTAIEALTGVSPDEIKKNPQTNEIVWPNDKKVNKKLTQILEKMVHTDFRERYQSADEVLKDLSQITAKPLANKIKNLWFILPLLLIGVISFQNRSQIFVKDFINSQSQNPKTSPNSTLQPPPTPTIEPTQPPSLDDPLNRVNIRLPGSSAMSKIKKIIKGEFEKKYKYSRIILASETAGDGIDAVEKSKEDIIAASSRPLTPEEKNKNLVEEPIAHDRLVFVTGNKNTYTNGFSSDQLRQIFGCEITNWSALGGAEKPIRVLMKPLNSGATVTVKDNVLNGKNFCKNSNFETLSNNGEVQELIPKLRTDAIGYGSSINLAEQDNVTVQQIDGHQWDEKKYPYKRKLFLVYKNPPSPKVKAFIAFVKSREVQQAIKDIPGVIEP
ncbi:serine/threonine-protein kinase [Nostoc sp. DedSLP04]|uniref:serine/threonine-protein kinase n=1 Tax=Nostoc sp. DedSLP04 TaxID=3075401 RepID=UPI002AD5A011|nr:serine/threonine-protein kinase [Nostoc sp. DedSLP04]MDZ8029885.1 serine/threonine-protein kinase [Nostoc sp. DedSLP04]